MGSAADTFSQLLDNLLRMLGLRKSEDAKLRATIDQWRQKKKSLQNEVDSLKDQIRVVETELRGRSRELDATPGESRSVVERQIKSLLRELDLKSQKHDIIFGGLDRINQLIEKADQALVAQGTTVDVDVIRALQLQFGEVLGALKEADREGDRLGGMQYKPASSEPVNYEARKAAYAEPAAVSPTQQEKPASVLSEADRQRMANIVQNNN